MELKKLPAKKKLLSQLKQQNAIQNQLPPSSISVIPLNSQAHTTTTTKMDQDEDEIVHDDDSPLDMRITKQQDSDELRPSVIRKRKREREKFHNKENISFLCLFHLGRAPSFKENSNSPIFCGKYYTKSRNVLMI
jgi:hypothetical protein